MVIACSRVVERVADTIERRYLTVVGVGGWHAVPVSGIGWRIGVRAVIGGRISRREVEVLDPKTDRSQPIWPSCPHRVARQRHLAIGTCRSESSFAHVDHHAAAEGGAGDRVSETGHGCPRPRDSFRPPRPWAQGPRFKGHWWFDGVCSGLPPARHPASPERVAPESSGCLAPPARPQLLALLSGRSGDGTRQPPLKPEH